MGLTVKQKIYNTLLENRNGFMTLEDIARVSYKDAMMKETRNHLVGLVKRSMPHAIAMLAEDNYLVIKDLEPTKSGIKLKYKGVSGYKIADVEDIDMVKTNLMSKDDRISIATTKKLELKTLASENGLLDEGN